MKGRILYMFVVSFVAFMIFILGLVVILFKFEEATWTTVRVWAGMVFAAACIWNLVHFYRKQKKEREEKENENDKGVY